MHTRRNTPLSPLAIVLPHPQLPRRRSSLLSPVTSTPHTPRSCNSPTCPPLFLSTPNRKSTDSWNSSNGPEDFDAEWKTEHVLLLSRTLDALPAHLVTPFNGPIPPSNLLDKIARGVSEAKGPVDWPYSLRATRVKLIELCRTRAKDETTQRRAIKEEPEHDGDIGVECRSNYSYVQDGASRPVNVSVRPRRPLYRQSSMDFINATATDLKDNDTIARLSYRLQRPDRLFPSPTYHPYSRTTGRKRSVSPPGPAAVPSLINPSTPSSSTLNSLSSMISSSAHVRLHRRKASSLSLSSGSVSMLSVSSGEPLPDPRVQRVRRADSFYSHSASDLQKDSPFSSVGTKRAPSFGALAQVAKENAGPTQHQTHAKNPSGSYPSSDEEEKLRTRKAKKPRTRGASSGNTNANVVASPRGPSPPLSSAPSSPAGLSTAPPSPVVLITGSSKKRRDRVPNKDHNEQAMSRTNCVEPVARSPSNSKEQKVKPRIDLKREVIRENPASLKKVQEVENESGKTKHPRTKPKMNLQRNPSMFGAELPHLNNAVQAEKIPSPSAPAHAASPGRIVSPHANKIPVLSPSLMLSPAIVLSPTVPPRTSVLSPVQTTPCSPQSLQKLKTLRRVRRLAPGRRISFGSLMAPGEEADADCELDAGGEGERGKVRGCLGSAIQLL